MSNKFTTLLGSNGALSDRCRQEKYVAFCEGKTRIGMLQLSCTPDAYQHARKSRHAYVERRLPTHAPQPEIFTIEQLLAFYGR